MRVLSLGLEDPLEECGRIYFLVFILALLSCSVQFSHSVLSNCLWPHGLQDTRLPRPSPTPGTCSNSCPLSQWCHPIISSPVIPFSSCFQSFPASGSFTMNLFFALDGQSIGAWASASALPMISFRIDWFDVLAVQGTLKSLLQHHSSKASILQCSALWSNSYIHTWLLEKP